MSSQLTFTVSEAAAITGLPARDINKAIEKKTVPVRRQARSSSRPQRSLAMASLVCLALEAKGLSVLPLRVRRQVYDSVARNPAQREIRQGDAIVIDVARARREVQARAAALLSAKQMVVSDPGILGGTPVFRGTRVPVHGIANMVSSGVTLAEIRDGYPSVSKEQIRLSLLYAAAVPRRGRPPVQPWSGAKPVRRTRKRMIVNR